MPYLVWKKLKKTEFCNLLDNILQNAQNLTQMNKSNSHHSFSYLLPACFESLEN